jgi:hypothetical protein
MPSADTGNRLVVLGGIGTHRPRSRRLPVDAPAPFIHTIRRDARLSRAALGRRLSERHPDHDRRWRHMHRCTSGHTRLASGTTASASAAPAAASASPSSGAARIAIRVPCRGSLASQARKLRALAGLRPQPPAGADKSLSSTKYKRTKSRGHPERPGGLSHVLLLTPRHDPQRVIRQRSLHTDRAHQVAVEPIAELRLRPQDHRHSV